MAKSKLLQKAYAVETPDEVNDLYHDWAESYDQDLLSQDLDYVAPQEAVQIFKSHFTQTSAAILDVGCGTGLSGLALANAGFTQIDGIDLSPAMLEQARQKKVYQTLQQADLLKGIELPDNHYQAALSVGTFTHGHVGPDAIKEVLRIIKPDGLFCLTVNEGVFDKMDYPSALKQLEQAGLCSLCDITDADYLRGEGIRSKVVSLHAR